MVHTVQQYVQQNGPSGVHGNHVVHQGGVVSDRPPERESVNKMDIDLIVASVLANMLNRRCVYMKKRVIVNGANGTNGVSAVKLVAQETDPDTENVSKKGLDRHMGSRDQM